MKLKQMPLKVHGLIKLNELKVKENPLPIHCMNKLTYYH